jgi:NADH:ubiquinone oxidoreductase subunit 6 (subunit J)
VTPVFLILAALTTLSAIAAVAMRNLVHCALALTVTFAGLAGLYLQLDAQFVGFAQVLVYIGAVAILIVFTILLTRGSEPVGRSLFSSSWFIGLGVAVCVFGILCRVILSSKALARDLPTALPVTVHQIGDQLMTRYILPLELLGLLLTAALIGAVIIAMREHPLAEGPQQPSSNGRVNSTEDGHDSMKAEILSEPNPVHSAGAGHGMSAEVAAVTREVHL